MMPQRLAVAFLVVSAACGTSRQEQEVERLAQQCRGFVAAGATTQDAIRAFPTPDFLSQPICRPNFASIGGNDTCPASSSENEQCQVLYYWFPTDPGLCEPGGGCWVVCETRVMRQDPAWGDSGSALDAKICASRFLRGQPPP